ncbi:MAG: potassium transporter TrkA, partial [Thermoplasmatales archaeon]|nr:potassium transporter TrkA [Thermoplasmatales archaeon]
KDSKACNQKIGDLKVETETGMRLIAIRRGECWIYNPQSDTSIQADDWLITRGTDEGYKDLRKFLHGELEALE